MVFSMRNQEIFISPWKHFFWVPQKVLPLRTKHDSLAAYYDVSIYHDVSSPCFAILFLYCSFRASTILRNILTINNYHGCSQISISFWDFVKWKAIQSNHHTVTWKCWLLYDSLTYSNAFLQLFRPN